MVLIKIALIGVAFAVMLGVAKHQQWFERAGITARCTAVAAPAGQDRGHAWYVCTQGILTGFPTLERESCSSGGFVAHREIWECETPLESMPGY